MKRIVLLGLVVFSVALAGAGRSVALSPPGDPGNHVVLGLGTIGTSEVDVGQFSVFALSTPFGDFGRAWFASDVIFSGHFEVAVTLDCVNVAASATPPSASVRGVITSVTPGFGLAVGDRYGFVLWDSARLGDESTLDGFGLTGPPPDITCAELAPPTGGIVFTNVKRGGVFIR